MATLLLRLQAPMQSWGVSSLFTDRDSAREPSKSGVIGLICAALGRPRWANISDLTQLLMGVRVDREGVLEKDFQIAQNIMPADGSRPDKIVTSNRYYLSDAVFLVGLEGEINLLDTIQKALLKPRWPLYLGRRAFPPSAPVYLHDSLQNKNLLEALLSYPTLVENPIEGMRLVIESPQGEFMRQDVPLDFEKRLFTTRRISILSTPIKQARGG